MKIASIVGARPQFIKAAAFSRACRSISVVDELIIHTGQHYDQNMSDVFFEQLQISKPFCNLGVGSGLHGYQTGRMLESIEGVLLATKPDCVLVYGDTNSTLAGAVAAAKLLIPVAHVEAGMRSFSSQPEELNRVLTDHCSDFLFVSTETGIENLRREGIPEKKMYLVGDVMYDAALFFAKRAETSSHILQDLHLRSGEYILATIHRAENTDNHDRLCAIFYALAAVAADVPVVLPLHPRTRRMLLSHKELTGYFGRLNIVDPVSYLDMIMLQKNARIIATDSGGVQKEAFFYRVPCVTLREQTEWCELIDLGWNRLVPPLSASIVESNLRAALSSPPGLEASPYGDGTTALKILEILVSRFHIENCFQSATYQPMVA